MFGHYRLDSRLGKGGGGEVWKAYDTRLERTVALKTMRTDLDSDPAAAERFRREARLAARLDHPNIVRVHSADEIDGQLYIDMQLVHGGSLADLGRAGLLDPARVAAIVGSVAAALDRAHGLDGRPGLQMIHRDVKPSNILVDQQPGGQDHVYLADFGVARPVDQDAGLTLSGFVLGTPDYLAPELWQEREPDHRIDVYALAVTTFEMLAGQRPFTGRGLPGLMNEHLHAPVPRVTSFRPDLPAAVDEVLARGMAKDREDRYPTAGDFAGALRSALAPAPAGPPAGSGTYPRTVTATRNLPVPPAVQQAAPTVPPVLAPRPYLASPRHFAGLGGAALAVPLYLLDVIPAGWQLAASAVLLYALGVVLAVVVRPGRP